MLEFLPRPVVGAFAVLGVVIQQIGDCSCADEAVNYATTPGIRVDGPDTVFTKDAATFEVVNQGLGHGKPCPQEANFQFDSGSAPAVPIHNPKTHRLSNGDCVVDRVFAAESFVYSGEVHVKVELSADGGATRALGSRILHVVDRPKPATSTPVSTTTTTTTTPSPSSGSASAGGGAGSSTPASFCPTTGSAGAGFTAPESCPLTGHGVAVTTGLFTNASLSVGYPDVAVAQDAVSSSDADSVMILPQANGGSRFDSPSTVSLGVGADPVDLLGADLDNDGAPDIAVAEARYGNDPNGYDDVAFLHNDPNNVGTFTVSHIAAEQGVTGLAGGDLDKDGYIDLVTSNSGGSLDGATVLFNKGSAAPGTFLSPDDISEASGSNADAVGVADFNGDGSPDIVIANGGDPNSNPSYSNSSVAVVRNEGVADPNFPTTFDTPQTITTYTGHLPIALAVGDLDGDGKPDIVVANHVDNTISVLHNTTATNSTSFTFTETVLPGVSGDSSGHNPIDVAIGDVDGDGRKDIVVANAQSNNVSVYHQAVGGAFGTPDHLSAGTLPYGIAAGDLDQDGRADIEVANYGPDGYSAPAGPGTATIYRTSGASTRRALLRAAPVAKLPRSVPGRRTLTVKGKPVLVPVSLGRTSYGSDGSGHLRGALAVGTLNARVAGSRKARRSAPAAANDILHSHFVARLDVDRWLVPAAGNPITMRGYLLAQSTKHPKLMACLRIGLASGAHPYERVRLVGGTGRLGRLRMVTNLSLLSLDVAPPAGPRKSTMKMTIGYRHHRLGLPRQCRALRSKLKASTTGKHRKP